MFVVVNFGHVPILMFVGVKIFWSNSNQNLVILIWSCELALFWKDEKTSFWDCKENICIGILCRVIMIMGVMDGCSAYFGLSCANLRWRHKLICLETEIVLKIFMCFIFWPVNGCWALHSLIRILILECAAIAHSTAVGFSKPIT